LTFDAERISLETRFDTNWILTPIKWPNVTLTTKSLNEWVAFSLVQDISRIAQKGSTSNVYRYFGNTVIQIFIRPFIGSARALELATDAATIWRTSQFDNITLHSPRVKNLGIVKGWYQINLTNLYHRDSYKAVVPT